MCCGISQWKHNFNFNYNLFFLFRERRVGICTLCVIQGSKCRLRGDWSIAKLSQTFVQLK